MFVLFLALTVYAAEWEVASNYLMTIALGVGVSGPDEVYVAGSQDGVGGLVLHSTDGALTWNSQPHSGQLLYMDTDMARDSTMGVAGGIGIGGISAGASFTNDGQIWQAIPDNNFLFTSQNVVGADNSTFYCVGAYQHTILDDYHEGVMMSSDSGRSMQYFDANASTWARYGSFPSENVWYISAGQWPSVSNTQRRSLHEQGKFAFSENIEINIETGFASILERKDNKNGYSMAIAKTTDGGQTFRNVVEELGTAASYPNGISCPTINDCWFVSEGSNSAFIHHTSDGGLTWEVQYECSGGLFQIDMITTREGWAVGLGGISSLYLHTMDGGITWTQEAALNGVYANSVRMYDANHGYSGAFVVGGQSSILRYR
eukprot:Lithocolla_globosa_v1_NODE_5094_length_1306_cov_657.287770.p1 type:complete len:374 gc:universal NODE_5094_length_1306_cov_657.287770:1261-140(-)